MDEHAEAVQRRVSALFRFFEQAGLERAVDEVADRRGGREGFKEGEVLEVGGYALHAQRSAVDEERRVGKNAVSALAGEI